MCLAQFSFYFVSYDHYAFHILSLGLACGTLKTNWKIVASTPFGRKAQKLLEPFVYINVTFTTPGDGYTNTGRL